jgi:hypothetical protein
MIGISIIGFENGTTLKPVTPEIAVSQFPTRGVFNHVELDLRWSEW